jgi:MFS family permease
MQDIGSHRYRNYLLTVLLVILAFNFVDRMALGLVLQDIKTDLHLSDTQLGLLTGIAFALFYSVMGIPIARWADRGNRVLIIALTTAFWSAAVAICGLIGSFSQLMLTRIIVGVGEAGCVPTAHSLIAEYFTRAERPRAISVYMQGIPASVVVGYFVAGWLNEFYGWRMMFLAIGLPGFLLAGLAWFSLRDPRGKKREVAASTPVHPNLKEVWVTLWASATFRHLLYSYSVSFFFSYGVLQWTPAYFVRSFGLKSGQLGTWLAVIYGVSCVVGTYLSGEWATRRAAHNERLQLQVLTIVICISCIFCTFVYLPALTPNYYLAFVWLGLFSMTTVTLNIPAFAVIQTLVPAHMRAMAIALVYLFANLIGMGFGPWATGALSDALWPWVGKESLRYALLALSPGFFWVAWHLWQASRTVTSELQGKRYAEQNDATEGSSPPDLVRYVVTDTGGKKLV